MKDSAEVRAVMRQARSLEESGFWDEAIHLLTDSNKQLASGVIETHLVDMRHTAYYKSRRPLPEPIWPKPVPDHFPGVTSVPEIPASELSVELVSSAIHHHGSIIVRGMFDPAACEVVRNCIDEAFAGVAAVTGQRKPEPTPWYSLFVPQEDKGYHWPPGMRYFVKAGFGVLAVDSPRALFRYLNCLSDIGFDKFLYEYFGERPAISAKKSTLRCTPPNAAAGWHQDGGYFRNNTRAVNLWAAFSSCGVDAPSLDIFAKRFDTFVEQGRNGTHPDAVSDETAASYGEEFIVRPKFEPGDAVLFDEMALHRTGIDKSMTRTRYAVEMWFFAASMFPHDQVPIYL